MATIAVTSVPTHSLQRQEHCHYSSNISANTLTAEAGTWPLQQQHGHYSSNISANTLTAEAGTWPL